MTSAIEPATFQLVTKCLNQLRYRVPLLLVYYKISNSSLNMVHYQILSFHEANRATGQTSQNDLEA
jgi:hypothetical protein